LNIVPSATHEQDLPRFWEIPFLDPYGGPKSLSQSSILVLLMDAGTLVN
jgi:hypothetical protein